jgi:hypothetical protein
MHFKTICIEHEIDMTDQMYHKFKLISVLEFGFDLQTFSLLSALASTVRQV